MRETLRLFRTGLKPEAIAKERGLVISTIYGHLVAAAEAGEPLRVDDFFSTDDQAQIVLALGKASGDLGDAKELLGGTFDYGALRLYRALRSRK